MIILSYVYCSVTVDSANRREIVKEIANLRRAGESQSYMERMFLSLIVMLCCAKIVSG
jgi:hypothetical protein